MMVGKFTDEEINGVSAASAWVALQLFITVPIVTTLAGVDIPDIEIHHEFAVRCPLDTQGLSTSLSKHLQSSSDSFTIWQTLGLSCLILVAYGFLYYCLYKIRHHKLIRSFMPEWIVSNFTAVMYSSFTIIYAILCPGIVIYAEELRQALISTKNASAGGDRWGYGQTTAILLWMPFLYCGLTETLSKQIPPRPWRLYFLITNSKKNTWAA